MKPLTMKQAEVVLFWKDFSNAHGYPPTIRETCDHFGYKSTNAAASVIAAIESKGVDLKRRKRVTKKKVTS